jgi:hypothetical protein
MPTRGRNVPDTLFPVKGNKAAPYAFVLDAIAALSPEVRPMFGCLAVYVGDKIIFMLREKHDGTPDDGVWLATTEEHHESLRREGSSNWQGAKVTAGFGTPGTEGQREVVTGASTPYGDAASTSSVLPKQRDRRLRPRHAVWSSPSSGGWCSDSADCIPIRMVF